MLLAAHLHDANGHPLPLHEMKIIAAGMADFNAKVVDTPAAHKLLYDAVAAAGETVYGPDAPITLQIWTEGTFPDGTPAFVQVWLEGSTSAIPVSQR